MVQGHLTHTDTKLPTKFNFIVTGVQANIENQALPVKYLKEENLSQTEVAVFHPQTITLKVHNLEDRNFQTLENLTIDNLTFEFSGFDTADKGNLTNITLTPQGTLSGAITSLKMGTQTIKDPQTSYTIKNISIPLNNETKIPITITFDPEKVHNGDTLWFVVDDFGVSAQGVNHKIQPDDHKTATITYKNPTITLKGDGKESQEIKIKKSEVNLGNLTFLTD